MVTDKSGGVITLDSDSSCSVITGVKLCCGVKTNVENYCSDEVVGHILALCYLTSFKLKLALGNNLALGSGLAVFLINVLRLLLVLGSFSCIFGLVCRGLVADIGLFSFNLYLGASFGSFSSFFDFSSFFFLFGNFDRCLNLCILCAEAHEALFAVVKNFKLNFYIIMLAYAEKLSRGSIGFLHGFACCNDFLNHVVFPFQSISL